MFKKFNYHDGSAFGHALEGNLHLVFTQGFETKEQVGSACHQYGVARAWSCASGSESESARLNQRTGGQCGCGSGWGSKSSR